MRNYLDSLVAKSLGLAEGVLPRPLSLYEPLPFGEGPAEPDGNSLLDSHLEQTPVRSEPVRQGSVPAGPKANASEKQSAPHREAKSSATSIPHQAGMLVIPAEEAAKPAEQSELKLPAGQQPVASHVVIIETERDTAPDAVTAGDRRTTGTQGIAAFIPVQDAPEGPQKVPGIQASATLLIPPLKPRPVGDHEHKHSLPERIDQMQLAAKAEHEGAPTIKITIGRVDVRAVMPDQAALRPTRERRTSARSLEEYLKQRSGGKP